MGYVVSDKKMGYVAYESLWIKVATVGVETVDKNWSLKTLDRSRARPYSYISGEDDPAEHKERDDELEREH